MKVPGTLQRQMYEKDGLRYGVVSVGSEYGA